MFKKMQRAAVVAAAALLAAGCEEPRPSVSTSTSKVKVTGAVTYEGKPLASGKVSFNPANADRKFVPISVAEIIRTTGENYSRMTEMVSPYNKSLSLPWVMGAWSVDSLQGLARLAKEINRQAAMIGYVNAFALYTATSAAAIAVVVFAKKRRRVAVAAAE